MRQIIIELCGLLEEQKSVLHEMLDLARKERSIIVSGEASLLEDIVRREFRELSKLGAIEKKRLKLHAGLSAEFGLPEKDITVTAIAAIAESDEREALGKLQTELRTLVDEHSGINKENRELIDAHMEYSEMVMNLMVGSEDPLNNFYGGDGKAVEDSKRATAFFDGRY